MNTENIEEKIQRLLHSGDPANVELALTLAESQGVEIDVAGYEHIFELYTVNRYNRDKTSLVEKIIYINRLKTLSIATGEDDPSSVFCIDDKVQLCIHLENLWVYCNRLEVFNVTPFKTLSIPESLTQVQTLKVLRLLFFKNISPEVGLLSQLKQLNLEEVIEFPEEVNQLQQLQHLNFVSSLATVTPSVITELSNLSILELGLRNTKQLPVEKGCWPKLEALSIGYIDEQYGYPFPYPIQNFEEVAKKLPYLKKLSVIHHPLETLNKVLPHLQDLEELNITSCNLKEVPEAVKDLPNLKILNMRSNYIPVLPDWLQELPNLTIYR